MSYILDALRKSETERRQGKIPDLGQQVQLIHKPRKKSLPAALWIVVALVINAVVLAVIFWPSLAQDKAAVQATAPVEPAPVPAEVEEPVPTVSTAEEVPKPEAEPAVAESGEPEPRMRPTIIVPNRSLVEAPPAAYEQAPEGRVPHLVELPVPFQKSIPDLMFNSHIYASEPSARRVMINNQYMRVGDSFSGIRVERITDDGVELSKDGRRFRVGVVRDWVSPR
ncbi:general secretion pathway protein GspB [Marinobacter sp.]|uniref:general secretion pathway protein GspB n=1 Tax=Marinobacter sp. TaxID=50741 RepID=UPI0034A44ABF